MAQEAKQRINSETFRIRAFVAAKGARPNAEKVIESMINAIACEDFASLSETIAAAGAIEADDTAVAVVAEALNHEKAAVRVVAAEQLGELGFASRKVLPKMICALEDECEAVRSEMATALGSIGPEAEPAIPSLLACTARDNSSQA